MASSMVVVVSLGGEFRMGGLVMASSTFPRQVAPPDGSPPAGGPEEWPPAGGQSKGSR